MADRGLSYALCASILIHGLLLGLGHDRPEPAEQAPRLIEATLTAESFPSQPSEPSMPEVVRNAAPAKDAAKPAKARQPAAAVVPVLRLASEKGSDERIQHVAASPVPAPVSPALLSATPAAIPSGGGSATGIPSGASSVAAAEGASGSATASYSPPSFSASYLHNPKPVYPMMARRRGLEGFVRLDVKVSPDGVPTAIGMRDSSGNESFDEAARNAVWHWKFSPARRGGEAVEGAVVVPVRFILQGDAAE